MASVDDRIVRMEFDNAAFEKKISSTLASLGQLDKALKLTGATQGLSNVGQAADKLHFGSISDGIENVSKKFIALSTIAITALAGITTKAIEAGAQLAKSFTIAPIIDGFKEYETQLNSVQTILANTASKGTTLDQVNAALQQLNEYSDQTIYNFGQMARNIGTFTAAGVDLDTSVQSIKGIANLAAMSGSSAEQASNAMYQLSQAIATGSLKLIDWNSVVNAGMGGEAFKSALFETGKAMGNVLNVPVDQTFKEWEDSGNSFRDSLQDGWITADILTTTLSAFTGDMTEEMLLAKGFNQQQATAILKTAAIAKAAATEVKTFTQLVGTVKEAVGTGWADSFKIIIGNFTEAKALWTDVNNSIGAFIQKNANARNELLEGWKEFGGRTVLIESLKTTFQALGQILAPIKEAFRDIFPPVTVKTLLEMTLAFKDFANALIPSASTVATIKTIFTGLFAALSIGWEIIKEGTKFIAGLVKSLAGLAGPGAVGFLTKLAEGVTGLQAALVKGGGIKDFFATLTSVLQKPLALLGKVRDAIGGVFDLFDNTVSDKVSEGVDKIGSRFQGLKDILSRLGDIWAPLETALSKIVLVLDAVWEAISNWFKELGQKLAAVMKPGDFDAALDAINVGLLGGIAALLAKFIKTGFNFDIGSGMLDKVGKSFEQLTGVMKSMQMNIKAEALMKIAGAIAILTASVLVLSMIDSASLTKALAAMAVGFTELMGSFAVFTKMADSPKSAATFTVLSTGLVLLSTAILILSVAVRSFAGLSWDELARGLFGVTAILAILIVTMKPLAANSKGMIAAGVGITAMAVALTILAGAVKIFASMSWEEMAQGLIGVSLTLLAIAGAMKLMPDDVKMVAMGAGLLLVGIAMNVLAGAILIFGHMKWEVMGKGMLGLAGGLLIIAGAMHLMPESMPLIAAGLVLVGIAVTLIAAALKLMGKMSWEEIAKGLVALGGALLIIAGACKLMEEALPGAAAILVVSIALTVLAGVLKVIGKMSWEEIAKGLVAIALALLIFGGVSAALSEAIPAMLGLGIALLALGAGFALFGAGVFLVGKGLESIAKSGAAAAEALPQILKALAKSIPALMTGLAEGIVDLVKVFTDAAPVFAKAIIVLLGHIVDGLDKLIPKVGKVIRELIEEIFKIIQLYVPKYIETGLLIITSLLQGISDNIGLITTLVIQIVVNFINAIAANLGSIIQAGVNLLIAFIQGITNSIGQIMGAITQFVIAFIAAVVSNYSLIITAGVDLFIQFLSGITNNLILIVGAVSQMIQAFITAVGNEAINIVNCAVAMLVSFLDAIAENFLLVVAAAINLVKTFIWGIGTMVNEIVTAGAKMIVDVIQGIGDNMQMIIDEGVKTVIKFLEGVGKNVVEFADAAFLVVANTMAALRKVIDERTDELAHEGWLLMGAVINGMALGLPGRVKGIFGTMADYAVEGVKSLKSAATFGIVGDPYSLVFLSMGEALMNGMRMGIDKGAPSVQDSMDTTANGVMSIFRNSLSTISDALTDIDEFSPTITPVLDLTEIAKGASAIGDYIQDTQKMVPFLSTSQARIIASAQNAPEESSTNQNATGEVKFEQNIFAPTQLSTSDIYKQTRNQIRIAKEELSIP